MAHTLANRTAGASIPARLVARLAVLVAVVALCLVGLQQSANAVATATSYVDTTPHVTVLMELQKILVRVTAPVPNRSDASDGTTISWEIQGSGFRAG